MDVVDQLIFGQVAAQQHFIADRENIRVAGFGDLDRIGDFHFVLFPVVVEPDADHGLEPFSLAMPGISSLPSVQENERTQWT